MKPCVVVTLPKRSRVQMNVYDLLGRTVAKLADETREAGRHEYSWDAGNAASGVYLVRLTTNTGSVVKRVTLVK